MSKNSNVYSAKYVADLQKQLENEKKYLNFLEDTETFVSMEQDWNPPLYNSSDGLPTFVAFTINYVDNDGRECCATGKNLREIIDEILQKLAV